MNFKILSLTIVVAASLAALASMPITATPAYAGGNVKVSNTNHVHNNDGDTDIDQDCVGQDITGSCNTTTTPGGGGGGGGSTPPTCNSQGKPPGCVPG